MKKYLFVLLFVFAAALPFNVLSQEKDEVYNLADKMPEFQSGQEGLIKFLVENIKYPVEAAEDGIQGKVFIGFIVGTRGEVSEVKVTRGVHPLLDAEAVRVVEIMPPWIPGEKDGRKVRVSYSIPINFSLTKGSASAHPAKIDTVKIRELMKTLNETDKATVERLMKSLDESASVVKERKEKMDSIMSILKLK